MEVCNCSMFCCLLLYAPSSFAIILMGKGELVALLSLSSWCLVIVVWLFLVVPWVCLQFMFVVFPDHTHLFFSCFSACPVCCVADFSTLCWPLTQKLLKQGYRYH